MLAYKKELDGCKAESGACKAEMAACKAEMAACKAEMDACKVKLDASGKGWDACWAALEACRKELQASKTEMSTQLGACNEELGACRTDLSACRTELEASTEEVATLTHARQCAVRERIRAEEALRSLRTDVLAVPNIAAATRELCVMERQLVACHQQHSTLQTIEKQVASLEDHIRIISTPCAHDGDLTAWAHERDIHRRAAVELCSCVALQLGEVTESDDGTELMTTRVACCLEELRRRQLHRAEEVSWLAVELRDCMMRSAIDLDPEKDFLPVVMELTARLGLATTLADSLCCECLDTLRTVHLQLRDELNDAKVSKSQLHVCLNDKVESLNLPRESKALESVGSTDDAHSRAAALLEKLEAVLNQKHELQRPVVIGRKRPRESVEKQESLRDSQRQFRAEYQALVPVLEASFPEHAEYLKELARHIPHSSLDVSVQLSDFTIEDQRGRILFLKRNSDGALFAAKQFPSTSSQAFLNECHAMDRCRHPFVVHYEQLFLDAGLHCIVMPRYSCTVITWFATHNSRAEPQLRMLWQMCQAVGALHSCGIVHCDIKPDNIMAASQLESATPRIIDFDFSQSSEELERHILATTTQRLVVGGTEGFIAPELKQAVQANRMPLITPAIDVYALSCTIALLLNQGSVLAVGGGTEGVPNAVSSEVGAIQALLEEMGSEDPAKRPDMGTVTDRMQKLWEAEAARMESDEAARNCPVECSICGVQRKRCEMLQCQCGHDQCAECVDNAMRTFHEAVLGSPSMRVEGVPCVWWQTPKPTQRCAARFADNHSLLMEATRTTYRAAYRQAAERDAIRSYKEELERQRRSVMDAIAYIDENIFCLRCPKCRVKCIPTKFTKGPNDAGECLAMTCTACKCHFCGYCGADCGGDAHAHVMNVCGGPLFAAEAQYRKKRLAAVAQPLKQYLSRYSPETQKEILLAFSLDL